ncbi:MAG: protein kinase domain-containing protein, partial [bacterium]
MADESAAQFHGTSRFQIVRRLGAGGMGVVYEALDRERNARVALKTLRTMKPEELLALKNEFRALQDVNHRNLVTLGELIEDADRWFFTME